MYVSVVFVSLSMLCCVVSLFLSGTLASTGYPFLLSFCFLHTACAAFVF